MSEGNDKHSDTDDQASGSPTIDKAADFERHSQAVADPEALWQSYEQLIKTLKAHRPDRKTGWCERCGRTWPCWKMVRHMSVPVTWPQEPLVADLVTELSGLKDRIPHLCVDIANGIVTPSRLTECGSQLIALGERMHAQANEKHR